MAGETNVSTSSPLNVKIFSVTLQSEIEKRSVFASMMTGRKSTQRMAIAKRERMQTTPDMPIVKITDLKQMAGDTVSCDLFHIVSGIPVMGDEEMEGRGVRMTLDTMEVKINQTRFPINAGSRMTRKRTKHNLRMIARGNMASYFSRLNDQIIQTCLSGARGTEMTRDWNLPREDHAKFAAIMINPLQPPTSNRYFAAGGGDSVDDLEVTDPLTLDDIDVISGTLRDMPFPPAPIRVEGDPMGDEEPIWCWMVSERVWHYILMRAAVNNASAWRKFVADAVTRSAISKHPLFRGTAGLWNGMLIKRMPRCIRFSPGDTVKKTSSDSGAVTNATVPAGVWVDRSIILGGQAMALAQGDAGGSGDSVGAFPTRWTEQLRDHGNSIEIGAGQMDGKAKFRYRGSDGMLTDFGVTVVDSYAPPIRSAAGQTLRNALRSTTGGIHM